MISRRRFLCGTAISSLAFGLSSPVKAILHRGSPGFNGGLTQFNVAGVQNGGDFTFINLMKGSQGWSYNSTPPSGAPQPISELDANGYITSVLSGTNGVYTVFQMPSATQYSGLWIWQWDGGGTVQPVGMTNVTPGPGVTWDGTNLVSTGGTGNYATFNRASSGQPGVRVVATSAAPNNVRNMAICKYQNNNAPYGYSQDDYTLWQNGKQFSPQSIALVKSAKPGVIRSLGWGGPDNGTNDSQLPNWANRMPRTYWSYGSFYVVPAYYAGQTTNNGSDYSISFSGFSLTNKAMATVLFNANAPQQYVTTINYSVTSGQAITIPWTAHGLAVGNAVTFGNGGAQPPGFTEAQTYYIISSGFGANSFEVSATPGGSAVLATSTLASSCIAVSIPRININGTGFVPITALTTPIPGNVFIGYDLTQYPSTGHLSHLVYDATVGYFYMNETGFCSGVPPEVFVDYCAAVGAHPHMVTPYLAVEPVSDLMTSWAAYATSTYPWMKPRIEPPNECWNSIAAFRGTPYATSLSYALWPGQTVDLNQSYGKWCSTLGQAMSAQYGNDRTKYSMICSVQTASAFSNGIPDARLKSTNYVSLSGGQPAYKWVDRVCAANYYNPAERFTCQELIDAYAYSVTYASNPSQQSVLANGYAATSSNTGQSTIPYVTTCFTNLKAWAQGMPAGNTVAGMTCYEGGYSPDYLTGDWSTNITGASQATSCMLTLATTSQNPEFSGMTGNPAVAGMMLHITGVNGMTQLNCSSGGASFTTNSATINWSPANPLIVGQVVSFNSDQINFNGISPFPQLSAAPAPLSAGTPYYVVAVGSGTFQVSATKGGSAITITDASNLSASVNAGWLVTSVSGNSVTIDVNSSSFGAYASGGVASYDNSRYYSIVLRQAGQMSTACGTSNTAMNQALANLAGGGFVSEYPSNFIYTGTGSIWNVLNPDIYVALTPQWNSIVAWNNS